jgi:dTDP-4-dehydrorhamnose reductase
MTNILILGTTGMLASNLIEYFFRQGYNVYSTHSNPIGKHNSATIYDHKLKQRELYGNNFKSFNGILMNFQNVFQLNIDNRTINNLNSSTSLSKFFNTKVEFDLVINAIGMTIRIINEESPESIGEAFLVNSLFPKAISQICFKSKIPFYHT